MGILLATIVIYGVLFLVALVQGIWATFTSTGTRQLPKGHLGTAFIIAGIVMLCVTGLVCTLALFDHEAEGALEAAFLIGFLGVGVSGTSVLLGLWLRRRLQVMRLLVSFTNAGNFRVADFAHQAGIRSDSAKSWIEKGLRAGYVQGSVDHQGTFYVAPGR